MHGRHGGVPGRFDGIEPGKGLQGVEARHAVHAGTRRQARKHRGNQAVNVKERHDVEATITRFKRQARPDMGCRGADIGLRQGHDLGPRGRAGGMEHQRDVVGLGTAGLKRVRGSGFFHDFQLETAGRRTFGNKELGDAHAEFAGNGDGIGITAAFHDQKPCAKIVEVKPELIGTVCRIERRGGRASADRNEGRGHFRPVGQDNRNPVSSSHARTVERDHGGVDLFAQVAIGHGNAVGRAKGLVFRRGGGEQSIDGKSVHTSIPGCCSPYLKRRLPAGNVTSGNINR